LNIEIQFANQSRERDPRILLDAYAWMQPRPAGFRRHGQPFPLDLLPRFLAAVPGFAR
jgi:hypothetical protein